MLNRTLPTEIQRIADEHFQELRTKMPAIEQWPSDILAELHVVLGMSDFIDDALNRDPALVVSLPEILASPSRQATYAAQLSTLLSPDISEIDGYQRLRRFRHQEMVYIAWRDFLGSWSVTESLAHLSELAEAMIVATYQWQYALCCDLWGTPCNAVGEAQPMLILGMGKLGGQELNFSSDIDLIFTYPEHGETRGVRRTIDNAQFFTRLGQRIIKSLDMQSVDGFCYRVDMRLRPFGESGPLVLSFAAMEDYYQDQGRDWERYAMVKARVMGKERYPCYPAFRKMLRPFVFRRYIDFSAIQSLRRMKSMIQSEVRRRGLQNNIKLGAGGIREIEFIVQSFQLIRGGREPKLRKRGLLETLDGIEQLKLLSADEVQQLRESYLFLRRLENLLQAIHDQQTQTLPDNPLHQLRLAHAMGVQRWADLHHQIQQCMAQVHQVFVSLIGEEETVTDDPVAHLYLELWQMSDNAEVVGEIMAHDFGQPDAASLAQTLIHFRSELDKKTLGPRGSDVLSKLMPKVFAAIFDHPDAQFGLARVLFLLQNIVTRTTYLELLDEHPAALTQLVHLCTASPMISEQLARYPILLDELIDPVHLYHPTAPSQYRLELRDFMARIPEDDMEQQMEGLRQFKQICLLKIAAADIAGALPVMKVSDHLTSLAEAIVDMVVRQAWKQMTEKYGVPDHLSADGHHGFAIIGYGKVGGWELGYNSDLDLVFLHDCPTQACTSGPKEIDGRQFYLRLAQRIVHLFSTRTSSGILYEVDTRLRPSGASGMLVSSLEAFEEYQRHDAWTWEHQALVRARLIYGDSSLEDGFQRVRHQVLSAPRTIASLKTDVVAMREKMRTHLAGKKAGRFMLKQDRGGITDIEFLAQYLILAYSQTYPELTTWSDNVRIFESLAATSLMTESQSQLLITAYTRIRDQVHRRNLLNLDADVAEDKFTEERRAVIEAWTHWLTPGDDESCPDEQSLA